MEKNAIMQSAADELANSLTGSKLLGVYEYMPGSKNSGRWVGSNELGDLIAENLGLDNPVEYTAQRHEDVMINAALLEVNTTTGFAKISVITRGTQIIEFTLQNEQVIFGLNGGYDNRVFTLLRGESISLYPIMYGSGACVCDPDSKVYLIVSDKMTPQSFFQG